MSQEKILRRVANTPETLENGETENASGQVKSPPAPMRPVNVHGVEAVASKDRANQALGGVMAHKQSAP